MKLSKAIEWEIPIITTHAGRRGYIWKKGDLIEVGESPDEFALSIQKCLIEDDYEKIVTNLMLVKTSSPTNESISKDLKEFLTTI